MKSKGLVFAIVLPGLLGLSFANGAKTESGEGNAQSANQESPEIYVTRDPTGKLHFSDRPQNNANKVELSDSMNVTTWEKAQALQVAKAKPAPKGDNVLTKKQQRCEKLEKLINRYREKERQAKNSYRYRALRRQHQWQRLQMNC